MRLTFTFYLLPLPTKGIDEKPPRPTHGTRAAHAGDGADPAPAPPADKKAEPKKPEKAEQEPRPVTQELQKQESQKKDAPPRPQPVRAAAAGAVAPATEPEKKEREEVGRQQPARAVARRRPSTSPKGTWMSLDVSPTARRSSSTCSATSTCCRSPAARRRRSPRGIAWDMQPRYTPDGKWIAFTSDRGGGDNLWVMDRDGNEPEAGDARRASACSTARPGRPTASTSSARKHFTSRALARRGRDLALPPQRRRRPAADQEAQRPEGRRRARVLARRPLPLLQPGRHARRRSSSTTRTRTARSTSSSGSTARPARSSASSPARAARSGRRRRRTASRSPSSAACATRACSTSRDLESGARAAALRRPRARHAGDLGDPRRLPGAWPGRRTRKSIVFWAGGKIRRVDVGAEAGRRTSPSTCRTRARCTRRCASRVEVAPDDVRREDAALGAGLARRRPGGLPGARPPLCCATCPTARRAG